MYAGGGAEEGVVRVTGRVVDGTYMYLWGLGRLTLWFLSCSHPCRLSRGQVTREGREENERFPCARTGWTFLGGCVM